MESKHRSLSDQQQKIKSFVFQSVNFVLEELEGTGELTPNGADQLEVILREILESLGPKYAIDVDSITQKFLSESLPQILDLCTLDYARYPTQDPALSNLEEVLYASNGFWATVAHRLAHALKKLRVPIIPRTISGIAHSRTGVDIHPGASIGPGLFIDHGTGIAIGCTAVIGNNVSLYNGVVLGTRSKPSRTEDQTSGGVVKRHPTISNGVSLYTNAFVGGDVTVGENAVIGAYAFVCEDVAAGEIRSGRDNNNANREEEAPVTEAPKTNAPATAPGVISMIGNTPVMEIKGMHDNPKVRIFAKLEGSNPSGSVKDRIALKLIEQGEQSGTLTRDKIILESTSGNTGIGLAMVGAAKGYQVVLTMSAAMSEERKKVLRAFGATLVETDPTKGTGGAIEVANQMDAENPGKYWMARQHSSLDNPLAHYEHTATEILQQVPDVTHFVAGIGTFGTLRGAGVRLRDEVGAKVVGIEPVLGQAIQGLRNMNEPNSPKLYDESLLDQKLMAMAEPAYQYTRKLAIEAGLLVGMSSGAAMEGAVRVANSIEEGNIVVLLPDRGEKYLSTPLFDKPVEKPQPAESAAETNFSYAI